MGNNKTKPRSLSTASEPQDDQHHHHVGGYSDPFLSKGYESLSYSQIKRMYTDRTEFLSSIPPSTIPSRGVVPRFSILGEIKSNSQTTSFSPLDLTHESGRKLKETKLVYKIGSLEKELVALTYYGTVHLFNSNTKTWNDVNVNNEFIVDMEVSEVNLFLITAEGNMYACSSYNIWGQTGTNEKVSLDNSKTIVAKKVILPSGVTGFGSAYSGYGHTYFVTVPDKRLYFSGNIGLAQFAKQPTDSEGDMLSPVEIASPLVKGKSVKLIASGYAYCIAIFEDNSGVVFGSNDYQQLGYATPNKIYDPLPLNVPTNDKIKAISAGQWVSLVCTENNELFVTGNLGSSQQHNGWTKIDLSLHGINPNSLFDAYLIQNKVAILAKEKFVILAGMSKVDIQLSDVNFEESASLLSKRNLKYRVYPNIISGEAGNDFKILFFEDESNVNNHFIYKFNEKIDLCDVTIVTLSEGFITFEEEFNNKLTV